MRDAALAALIGLFVALIAAAGEPLAAPLHHVAGRLAPAPPVPVVVLRVHDLSDLELASHGGAASQWAVWSDARALPSVDDGRDRVERDRGHLRVDGRLLPMPEAALGLTHLDARRLRGLHAGFLDGLDVVVVPADAGPDLVRASDALAVAVGAARTDGWLMEASPASAAALAGLLAALLATVLRRTGALEAVLAGALLTAGTVALVFTARASGVVVPAMGLVAAALLPTGMAVVRSVLALGWPGRQVQTQAPARQPRRRGRPWAVRAEPALERGRQP